MRHDSWFLVEGLIQKFDLAVKLKLANDFEDLATNLGARPKTLRGWVQGSAGHLPGDIPNYALYALASMFAGPLAHLPEVEIRSLTMGPTSDLTDALSSTAPSVSAVMFAEAVTNEARLIRASEEIGLVEIGTDAPPQFHPEVLLNEWFRIEFKARHRCRYAWAIQNAGRRWGACEAKKARDGKSVLVPGIVRASGPQYMREREQDGTHHFFCIQSVVPFPPALSAALREPVELDLRALQMLVRFFEDLPANDRICQSLRFVVTKNTAD